MEDIKERQSYANDPKHEAPTMHGEMTKKRELMQGETLQSAKASKLRGQSFQELTSNDHGIPAHPPNNDRLPLIRNKLRGPKPVVWQHFNVCMLSSINGADTPKLGRDLLISWYKVLYEADNNINIKLVDSENYMLISPLIMLEEYDDCLQ